MYPRLRKVDGKGRILKSCIPMSMNDKYDIDSDWVELFKQTRVEIITMYFKLIFLRIKNTISKWNG